MQGNLLHSVELLYLTNGTKLDISGNVTLVGNFSYVINEEMMCADWDDKGIVLIIGVTIHPEDPRGRDLIRQTWGRTAKDNPSMKLIFFVGAHVDPYFNYAEIEQESNKYNDIVMADFVDSYRNLTRKSFAIFQWVTTYCPKAQYLLKIDSDMKIDLERLFIALKTKKIPDKISCGKIFPHERVFRQQDHKWYVSFDEYAPEFFPTYCHGPAYIVPRRILFRLTEVRLPVEPFPIEDVFVTGFLRRKLNEGLDDNVLWFNHERKKKFDEGYYGVIEIKN
ncbi:hypothetical protein FSP39_019802 [Pinctada imbricata]|uniref:Hexosyltransferase n=1 Tax=Pinctada imbricata TaxID=66713 RepID=A0AA88YU61_PINIB|nr:hypothetical protein FSP39_019802 [Pinctada imbricata]